MPNSNYLIIKLDFILIKTVFLVNKLKKLNYIYPKY